MNDTYYENLRSDATKGTHSLFLYSSYLTPGYFVLSSPASLLFSRLFGLAATKPTLSCLRSFSFLSSLSDIASTTLVRFLALLRLSSALPNPVLVHVPISATPLVSVPAPAPVPILCPSTGLHLRLRSYLALFRLPPPPSAFPLRRHHLSRPPPFLCVPVPDCVCVCSTLTGRASTIPR